MYKALSNIKFGGKLYVKGDEIDLSEKLGEQLEKDGVVEYVKEEKEEKKEEKKKDIKKKK